MDDLLKYTFGGGAALVVGLASIWVFRVSIAKALEKSLNISLEKYKHDLAKQHELLRHDLEKQMLRANLHIEGIHRVYPELYSKLRFAEGACRAVVGIIPPGVSLSDVIGKARDAVTDANNYRITNGLYISNVVHELAGTIYEKCRDSVIQIEMSDHIPDAYGKARTLLDTAGESLAELNQLMRAEMEPTGDSQIEKEP